MFLISVLSDNFFVHSQQARVEFQYCAFIFFYLSQLAQCYQYPVFDFSFTKNIFLKIRNNMNAILDLQKYLNFMEKVEIKSAGTDFSYYKTIVFCYTNQLMKYGVPDGVIILLMLIESIQSIAYGLISPLEYDSLGMEQFKILANLFYPDYYLRTTNIANYFVPSLAFISIIHFCLILITIQKATQEKPHRLCVVPHYLLIILTSPLMGPLLLTSSAVLVCSPTSPYYNGMTCYEGFHIFLCALALLNIFWLILCVLYVGLLYYTRNPFEFGYFSVSSNLWIFGKLLQRIFPVIFLTVDTNLEFNVLYLVGISAISLGYLFIFRFLLPYYRSAEKLEIFLLWNQIITFTVTAFYIPLFFIQKDSQFNIVFIFSILIGTILGYLGMDIYKTRKDQLILAVANISEDDETEVQIFQEFFYDFVQKVEVSREKYRRVFIFEVIKMHHNRCENMKCVCHDFFAQYVESVEYSSDFLLIYRSASVVIQEIIRLKKDPLGLNILKAYIKFEKLNSKYETVQELASKVNSKISYAQEAAIFSLLHLFKSSFHNLSTLEKYYDFSCQRLELEKLSLAAAFTCEQFCKQIIEQNCSISKLWKLINELKEKQNQIIEITENKILTIYPGNLSTLKLYYKLLRKIFRMGKKARQFQMQYQNKKRTQDETAMNVHMEYRANSDLMVLTIRKNGNSFEILSASSNVIKALGYHNWQLKGKNMNILLPKIYHKFHNEKMQAFMTQPDYDISNREGVAYPVRKDGFIIQCNYEVKLIPSMELGVQVLCFMKKSSKPNRHYIIYDDHTGEVEAMTKQFAQSLELEDYDHKNIGVIIPEWDIANQTPTLVESDPLVEKFVLLFASHGPPDDEHIKILEYSMNRFDYKTMNMLGTMFQETMGGEQEEFNFGKGKKNKLALIDSDGQNFRKLPEKKPRKEKKGKWKKILILLMIILFILIIGNAIAQHELAYQFIASLDENIQVSNKLTANCNVLMKLGICLKDGKEQQIQMYLQEMDQGLADLFQFPLTSQIPDNTFIIPITFYLEEYSTTTDKSLRDAVALLTSQIREYLATQKQNHLNFVYVNSVQIFDLYRNLFPLYHTKTYESLRQLQKHIYILIFIEFLVEIVLFVMINCWINECYDVINITIKNYESRKIEEVEVIQHDCEQFIGKFFVSYVDIFREKFKKKILKKFKRSDRFENQEKLMLLRRKIKFLEKPTRQAHVAKILTVLLFIMIYKFVQQFALFSEEANFIESRQNITDLGSIENKVRMLEFTLKLSQQQQGWLRSSVTKEIDAIERELGQNNIIELNHEKMYRVTSKVRESMVKTDTVSDQLYNWVANLTEGINSDLHKVQTNIYLHYNQEIKSNILQLVYVMFLGELGFWIIIMIWLWRGVVQILHQKIINSERMIHFISDEEQ